MNNILPYLLNGMLNGMFNNNVNNQNYNRNMQNNSYNQNNNNSTNYTNQNQSNYTNQNQNNYNNGYNNGFNNNIPNNNIIGSMGLFGNIFGQVFTTVMNNTDLIDNIVDSVMNSETVSSIINDIDSFDLSMEEYEDRYIISGKFPGVDKKDIQLDYDNGILMVKAKRKQVFSNGRNAMIAVVNNSEDFEKNFNVENVDTKRIKAGYNDNNLKITLYKESDELDPIIEVTNYTEE